MTANLYPALSHSLPLLGGTITHSADGVFKVKRANGRTWVSSYRCKVELVAFVSAINTLRKEVGLPLLALPCAFCGVHERNSPSNSYCSQECGRLAQGKPAAARGLRGPKSRRPRPFDFDGLRAALNEQPVTAFVKPERGASALPLRTYRLQVDALIERRTLGKVRPPKNGYLRPERFEVVEEQAS